MTRLLPGFLATLMALGLSLWARPRLPARVATHWGLDGSPDGWSSATVAAFGLPVFMLVLAGVFLLLPRLDPLQRAYSERSSPYWVIANVVMAFTAVLHATMLAFALGWPVRIATVAPIGVGLLFILIGALMHRMPPSWFMGIRTPWTLSSDEVWRKTHQLGGVCFAVAGVLLVVAGFARPQGLLVTLMIVAGVAAAVPVAYSYVAWREEAGRGRA